MSRGGPYSGYHDQPPAGWTHADQLLWLEPDEDELGVPYHDLEPVTRLHQFPTVFGVTAVRATASADTRAPDTPTRNPSPRGSLAPQLLVDPPA